MGVAAGLTKGGGWVDGGGILAGSGDALVVVVVVVFAGCTKDADCASAVADSAAGEKVSMKMGWREGREGGKVPLAPERDKLGINSGYEDCSNKGVLHRGNRN